VDDGGRDLTASLLDQMTAVAPIPGLIHPGREGDGRLLGSIDPPRLPHYYRARRPDDSALRMRLRELAAARPRFGCRRLHVMLRREGCHVNHKRTYRIYCEEDLSVRRKERRKRLSHVRVNSITPSGPNERWSMEFVADSLHEGRKFRILTVVDVFTRECLAVHADFSLTARKVTGVLEWIGSKRRYPKAITVDNGSEFISREMDGWAYRNAVSLDFIRPGRPVENCYIESFNGRLRDEFLNVEVFFDLEHARAKLREWKVDYNERRPRGSLDDLTPTEFAAKHQEKPAA
jgi:putative transposase